MLFSLVFLWEEIDEYAKKKPSETRDFEGTVFRLRFSSGFGRY